MAIPFLNNITIDKAGHIQFKTAAGANAGKIDQDGNNLVLTNAVGDILLGDGSSDVYIGDGTNNVDIIFEQSGSIKGDGSAVTLTLGGANTTLNLENPNINGALSLSGATTISNKLTFTTSNGYILFDYEPSGDTGEYSTETPLLKVDMNGSESTILSRISEYRAVALGIDDTVWLRAGDTGSVIKANVNLSAEQVVMSAEGGFHAYGFPGNDTAWSNRVEFKFRADSTTASDNGLYIGDGGNTQFIDLSRNLKNIGTINSGAITSTGTVTANQINLDSVGDYITFYGGGETNHSITSRELGGGTGDDIRINTYGSFIVNLDSNNNQTSAANSSFFVGRHGGNASGISGNNLLFQIDGATGNVLPGADSTHDLGTSSNRWANIYADTLYGDGSNLTNISATDSTKLPLSGGTLTGDVTSNSVITADTLKLTNDATDTTRNRISVYDSGAVSYGMMLWNANGTSGDWATMIYGPNQANRRISFGKANSNFATNHAGVDELAWLDLDNGNYFTDGSMYPSNQTTHYVSSGRIQNWQTAYTHSQADHAPSNADATPSWVPSSDPGYLTSSSTQSKYLRSDADDTATGQITLADSNASDSPLILGSSSQTTYTLQQFRTSSHGLNAAYLIAYGASHGSQAGNFAIKNTLSGKNIFFEVDGVVPLKLENGTSTITGNLFVTGDLNITGDINSYNVTDLDVVDKTITIGKGQTEANSGGSGIIVDGASASILWDESNTLFDFNQNINIETGSIALGGDVTLFRDGANILRTDDAFHANNNVYVGGAGKLYDRADNNNYIELADTIQVSTDTKISGNLTVGPSATTGGRILAQTYTSADRLGVISSHASSGNLLIGYGAEGKTSSSGDFVSTYGNFSGGHSALSVSGTHLRWYSEASNSTTSVGSDLTLANVFSVDRSGNVALSGTVDGVDIAALAAANTGDQDLSGLVTKASAQTISGAKTFSVMPTFNADTLHNGHIYGRSVNDEASRLYRFGGLWLTWDSDSYGTNFNHSITSTDNGTYSDSITINSFDKVRINIDSNNNDSASTFSIGKHGTGTSGTLLTLDEDGDLTITRDLYANKVVVGSDQDTYIEDVGDSTMQFVVGGILSSQLQSGGNLILSGTISGTSGTFTGNVTIDKNTPKLTLGEVNNTVGNAKIQLYSKNNNVANGFAIQYNKNTNIDRLEFIDGGGTAAFQFHNGGTATFEGDITANGTVLTGNQDISGIATNATAISNITSFPGFGTTSGTALEGDTSIPVDLTVDGAGTVHANNYTNTTYSVGDGGLTQNNLTNALKSNYDTAYTHSQAAHAPSNAEQNVQSDWNATSGDAFINNKPTIPSGNAIIDWTAENAGTIHTSNFADNNTFRTVEIDSNGNGSVNSTLTSSETLRLKKGSNVSLSESSGVVTISATNTTPTTTNVRAAGALMDDECASLGHVKAIDQSLEDGASPVFSTENMTDATNKRFVLDADATKLGYITITGAQDLDSVSTRANNGHTAFGWGNHASAGYSTATGVANNADVTPSWVPSSNPNYLTVSESVQVNNNSGLYKGSGNSPTLRFDSNNLISFDTESNEITHLVGKDDEDASTKVTADQFMYQTIVCHFSQSGGSTSDFLIPMNHNSESTSAQYYHMWAPPHNGRVETMIMKHGHGSAPSLASTAPTRFRIAKNSTSASYSSSYKTRVRVEGRSDDYYSYIRQDNINFAFNAGDRVYFKFQNSSSSTLWRNCSVSIVVRYNLV